MKKYFNYEGWYDGSPWLIEDNSFSISQLECFDINKINQNSMKNDLEEVVKTIISFKKNNRLSKIYIEYE